MITVVIATYNEASNIESLLSKLKKYSVIIVDDNSPDGTADIARKFSNVKVITPETRLGIAMSYRLGFQEALKLNPEYIIQMDAGLTHNPDIIDGLVNSARLNGYLLVYGTRFSKKLQLKSYRTLISLSATFLMKFIGVNASDVSCGFRCWSPALIQIILNKVWLSRRFAFQLETLKMSVDAVGNSRICGFPIEYKLTNSSFNLKTLIEAIWIYSIMLLS